MQIPPAPNEQEELPFPCTVCVYDEGVIGAGRVLAFYLESCHIESSLSVSPGTFVSLSLWISHAQAGQGGTRAHHLGAHLRVRHPVLIDEQWQAYVDRRWSQID